MKCQDFLSPRFPFPARCRERKASGWVASLRQANQSPDCTQGEGVFLFSILLTHVCRKRFPGAFSQLAVDPASHCLGRRNARHDRERVRLRDSRKVVAGVHRSVFRFPRSHVSRLTSSSGRDSWIVLSSGTRLAVYRAKGAFCQKTKMSNAA